MSLGCVINLCNNLPFGYLQLLWVQGCVCHIRLYQDDFDMHYQDISSQQLSKSRTILHSKQQDRPRTSLRAAPGSQCSQRSIYQPFYRPYHYFKAIKAQQTRSSWNGLTLPSTLSYFITQNHKGLIIKIKSLEQPVQRKRILPKSLGFLPVYFLS